MNIALSFIFSFLVTFFIISCTSPNISQKHSLNNSFSYLPSNVKTYNVVINSNELINSNDINKPKIVGLSFSDRNADMDILINVGKIGDSLKTYNDRPLFPTIINNKPYYLAKVNGFLTLKTDSWVKIKNANKSNEMYMLNCRCIERMINWPADSAYEYSPKLDKFKIKCIQKTIDSIAIIINNKKISP